MRTAFLALSVVTALVLPVHLGFLAAVRVEDGAFTSEALSYALNAGYVTVVWLFALFLHLHRKGAKS